METILDRGECPKKKHTAVTQINFTDVKKSILNLLQLHISLNKMARCRLQSDVFDRYTKLRVVQLYICNVIMYHSIVAR